ARIAANTSPRRVVVAQPADSHEPGVAPTSAQGGAVIHRVCAQAKGPRSTATRSRALRWGATFAARLTRSSGLPHPCPGLVLTVVHSGGPVQLPTPVRATSGHISTR